MDKLLITVFCMFAGTFIHAQSTQQINIDVTKIKTNMIGKGAGHCMIFQHDRVEMLDSLKETRPASLRFPMGAWAENYLFHDPAALPAEANKLKPKVATKSELTWGGVDIDANYFIGDKHLDFDEFMLLADSTNAEPVIMVPAQAHLLEGTTITKQQLITNAREWVRYANVTMNYGIKYWEIGNEVELHDRLTPAEYADLFVEITDAMKAIDSTISVGIGMINSEPFYKAVLEKNSTKVDFLVCHPYIRIPDWSTYESNSWSFVGAIATAVSSIDKYAVPEDRQRIKILATEHHCRSTTSSPNYLWKGLGVFEGIAVMFTYDDRVLFSHKWGTTWANVSDVESFDKNNNWKILNTGRPIQVFNQFLKETMLDVERKHGYIRSYASYSPSNKELTVYLVNNHNAVENAHINLSNYSGTLENEKWVFTGPSPEATTHTWGKKGSVQTTNSGFQVALDPVSITVITFSEDKTTGLNYQEKRQENAGFKIFPNPTSSSFSIEYQQNNMENEIFSVYNSLGTKVRELKPKNNAPVEVGDWASGLYYIHWRDRIGTAQKLIVQ